MEQRLKSYQDLIAWQKAIDLVTAVYSETKKFPGDERFNLISQLNRAAVSIPANIAEGWGRETSKNYLQFLRISRGSLMELQTLLVISKNLFYISAEKFSLISIKTEEVGKILQGLIKSINAKVNLTESLRPIC